LRRRDVGAMTQSARIKDLRRELSCWRPDDPPATLWLASELRELLDASFVGAYDPVPTQRGWAIHSMVGAGAQATANIRAFRVFVEQLPPSDSFLAYNPFLVDPLQRNRPLRLCDLPTGVFTRHSRTVLHTVGVAGQDQLRILLCNGPRLLSWFGATRAEPFTSREVAIFERLRKPLLGRVRLERLLRPRWPSALAVDAALEALARPAFILGPRRTIEVANKQGVAMLERGAREVLTAIHESQRLPEGLGAFSITPLRFSGCPDHLLAIQKPQGPRAEDRVSVALRRWKLTPSQTRVLELLVTGASNKQIAAALSCATVTVEGHVTELFRRSGAKSRTDLMMRLFTVT
jgi:DNA-binding CsgD family transcriptional regulator